MNKILLIFIIQILQLQFIMAQPPIVNCQLDTNTFYEITLCFGQVYDSSGGIKIQLDYGYATPNYNEPESFRHKITNEECTPFKIEIKNDVIYIYDSTGNLSYFTDNSNRFILNKGIINNLKIELSNRTNKTFNVCDIQALLELDLNIERLVIISQIDESNIKLNVNHWPFENIGSLFISGSFKEKKRRILRQLRKFKHLYKIEINPPYIN